MSDFRLKPDTYICQKSEYDEILNFYKKENEKLKKALEKCKENAGDINFVGAIVDDAIYPDKEFICGD